VASKEKVMHRRDLLKGGAAALTVAAAKPLFAWQGANNRVRMAVIGMGGRSGRVFDSFTRFDDVQFTMGCEVNSNRTQGFQNGRPLAQPLTVVGDYRRVLDRNDIDAVLIGTPDHWHAIISVEAMKQGKDVFCEKPETLTVRQGRVMVEIARRYARVFSGGSQRVWEDYNWFHRMVRGGAIGEVREAWVNVGGPSGPCHLPAEPTPADVDWDMWLGPAPWRPFHSSLIRGGFRGYRDYSGGGMTDWGCHGFGGALFTCSLHETGPSEIIPPDGKEYPQLTYKFASGLRMYHGGGWGGLLSFKGTEGEAPARGGEGADGRTPPDIHIPNYKGRGGLIGDFLHCVRTRERPFRDIELAHRTATLCHLGNIAYWLRRRIQWDPVKEEIIGDPEAARWLDRPARESWILA
jgi:hypothetical protein